MAHAIGSKVGKNFVFVLVGQREMNIKLCNNSLFGTHPIVGLTKENQAYVHGDISLWGLDLSLGTRMKITMYVYLS